MKCLVFLFIFSAFSLRVFARLQYEVINQDFKRQLKTELSFQSQEIDLVGARGEVRPLVLALKTSDRELNKNEEYSFELDFSAKIEPIQMNLFRMPQVQLSQPSFAGAKVGKYFDPLVPIVKKWFTLNSKPMLDSDTYFFWMDFKILQATRAGDYRGKLLCRSKSQNKIIIELPIKLRVWNLNLPEVASLPAYTELNPWYIELTHQQYPKENLKFLQENYFANLKSHGFYPLKSWVKNPEFSVTNKQIEFEYFDLLSKETPKSIFLDLPARAHFKQNKFKSSFSNEALYWQHLEKWIQAHQQFSYLSYYLDEPKNAQIENATLKLKKIRQWAPSLKIMMTTQPTKSLEDLVDIFVPLINKVEKEELKKQNTKFDFWWYVSCMSHGCESLEDRATPDFSIEREDSDILSLGVLSFAFERIKAFLYYHANYNYQFKDKDPWKNIYFFGGNGDGILYYPGRAGEYGLDQDVPVASLRLKLWRESANLYQYLNWLKEKDSEFLMTLDLPKKFSSPRQWVRNGVYYYDLRKKIGERLNRFGKPR